MEAQGPPDFSADIYSLGVLAFVLLAAEMPWGANTCELLRAAKQGASLPLRQFVPSVPDELAVTIESMLSPIPSKRPVLPEVLAMWRKYSDEFDREATKKAAPHSNELGPTVLISPVGPKPAVASSSLPQTILLPLVSPSTLQRQWSRNQWLCAGALAIVATAGASYLLSRRTTPAPLVINKPIPVPVANDVCLTGGLLRSARHLGDIPVEKFCIDRSEVSNGRFFNWLRGQQIRVEQNHVIGPDQNPWVQLKEHPALRFDQGEIRLLGKQEELPVVLVSAYAASAFCATQGGSLPTESQWLFAARGPEQVREYPWGKDSPPCTTSNRQQHCSGFSKDGPLNVATSTHDRTPEGVFDLFGNVSEWISPRRVGSRTSQHVHVGASFSDWTSGWQTPIAVPAGMMNPNTGFRCVRPSVEQHIRVVTAVDSTSKSTTESTRTSARTHRRQSRRK